jgi:uncharacterized protein YodC (DUF2158 family)
MSLIKQENIQFERRAIIAALSWLCDPLRTMANFKRGDTVQLKSGGPVMTISTTLNDGQFQCDWFDEGGVLKHGSFHPEQLKEAQPQEDGPFIA